MFAQAAVQHYCFYIIAALWLYTEAMMSRMFGLWLLNAGC
jgi:hypothetical protein